MATWRPTLTTSRRWPSSTRVIAYDYPGHGYTTPATADLELPDYVQHLLGLLDALDIDVANLNGESLGGWVAVKFAAAHPERTGKIVLNTPGGTMARPEVMERIRSLSQAAADDPSDERIRARLEWLMADPATVTDELVAIRKTIYAQPGFAESMRHILCLQDPEVRRRNLITDAELAAVPHGALVVWTSNDPSGPAAAGMDMAPRSPAAGSSTSPAPGTGPNGNSARCSTSWSCSSSARSRPREYRPAHRSTVLGPVVMTAVADAAARLAAAADSRRPCPPVRDLLPAGDINTAYAVQTALIGARTSNGATLVGWKIGLTNPKVQAQLGVDQPDFGKLLDDMACPQDTPVDHTGCCSPASKPRSRSSLPATWTSPATSAPARSAPLPATPSPPLKSLTAASPAGTSALSTQSPTTPHPACSSSAPPTRHCTVRPCGSRDEHDP